MTCPQRGVEAGRGRSLKKYLRGEPDGDNIGAVFINLVFHL